MKKSKKIPVFIALGLSLLLPEGRGQDPNYSQWLNSPLYYNPAFTGLNSGVRARLSFREQWPNLPVDYKTLYFSADYGDRNLPGSGGLGILVNRDNEGVGFIKNLYAGIALSARIRITRDIVCQLGMKASVVQKWITWSDFVFSDQLNERYGNVYSTGLIPPEFTKRLFPDFGAGGLVKFISGDGRISGTAGFAADHLFQPDESFYSLARSPLPRKYVGHLDLVLALGRGPSSSQNPVVGFGDPLLINPGVIYQNQHGMSSLQAGLNMLKYNVYAGMYLKYSHQRQSSTSLMLLAGYRYIMAEGINIRFMYSYDFQVSGHLQETGGAHEISLILEFQNIRIRDKNQYEECILVETSHAKVSALECSSF